MTVIHKLRCWLVVYWGLLSICRCTDWNRLLQCVALELHWKKEKSIIKNSHKSDNNLLPSSKESSVRELNANHFHIGLLKINGIKSTTVNYVIRPRKLNDEYFTFSAVHKFFAGTAEQLWDWEGGGGDIRDSTLGGGGGEAQDTFLILTL